MDSRRGKKNKGGTKNAWGNTNVAPKQDNIVAKAATSEQTKVRERQQAEKRFQAAKAKLEGSVQKHLAAEPLSSDEEEELQTDNILESVLQSYKSTGGNDLGRTHHFLEEVFHSGAATCLICIATVKHADAIWNCIECFCFFHLPCIQRWASDSIAQQKKAAEELTAPYEQLPKLFWGCPKCRKDHLPSDTPQIYKCFCGQRDNPPFKPWLVPHSCGETCQKPLQPECGHKCLLLCHPGPCPSCPQVVLAACFCKKSKPLPKRCSDKLWSCASTCGETLACGKHKCEDNCHPDQCEPCPRTSKQFCLCRSSSREQPCATPNWQCEKVCGKLLSCGNHKCEEECHRPGQCGPCPRSGARTCPCGKSETQNLPCTADVAPCGSTCGKKLSCKAHACLERCHKEKCGNCLQVSVKSCRCGLHEKELPCQKEYTCEVKCKRTKNCLRHPCNRKCCDGQCTPCEKVCGRQLPCGKHKCLAICHSGPCYPCPLLDTFTCACGAAKVTLPCGRKKLAKPPKCSLECKIPPDCHHPSRMKHKCHSGECPACKQTCGLTHGRCKHLCPAPCHSSVWVTTVLDPDRPLEGPWDKRTIVKEKKALACPDCLVPMPVVCLGGHEKTNWPCFKASPTSCGRRCGRSLKCGNHKCSILCHSVKNSLDNNTAGSNCASCELPCQLSRPGGCNHPCLLPCHPAPCKPCPQGVKLKCHCGLNQLHPQCHKWTLVNNQGVKEEIEKLLSCGNQCAKNYSCGHRCQVDCHSGECPKPEACRKKVKIFCSCKRLKKDFPCDVVRAGNAALACDDVCKEIKMKNKEAREKEEEQKRIEKENKEKEELEKFENWQQGKKKPGRERKRRQSEVEELSWPQRYLKTAIYSTIAAVMLGFLINLLQA